MTMNTTMQNQTPSASRAPRSLAANPVVRPQADDAECRVVTQLVPALHKPLQNTLLTAFPNEDLETLLPHLELVELPFEKVLQDSDRKCAYAYFPTTAIAALVYVMADGTSAEFAAVGREGVLGVSHLLGDGAPMGTTIVQSAGYGYRINASLLRDAFHRIAALRRILMRYMQTLYTQMARTAVTARHCAIEQQLCCWLLDRLDRLPSNELKVTQEFIANMLGVRRESISDAAGRLQDQGLIHYRRVAIHLLDREGLERIAGDCYQPEAGQPRKVADVTAQLQPHADSQAGHAQHGLESAAPPATQQSVPQAERAASPAAVQPAGAGLAKDGVGALLR